MNEQKEKNTQMLLESMPRYSHDYAYHPLQPSRNKSTLAPDAKPTNTLPEISRTNPKNTNSPFKLQSKLTHRDSRHSADCRDDEAQTDLTILSIKEMLSRYGSLSF
jgi:hypothetical protein